MFANCRHIKDALRIDGRAIPVKTLGQIARESGAHQSPLGFARDLGDALSGFERGQLSEDDTKVRLRRLGCEEKLIADVIAARRKRALNLMGEIK